MKITGIKKISRLIYNDEKCFVIEIQFDEQNETAERNRFGTIEEAYITNGRLNRGLSLINLLGAATVARAIELRQMSIDMQGLSETEKLEYLKRKYAAEGAV